MTNNRIFWHSQSVEMTNSRILWRSHYKKGPITGYFDTLNAKK